MCEYTLIRSARRSVGIRVNPDGSVTVRAPRGLSKADIDAAVEKHAEWIARTSARRSGVAALTDGELLNLKARAADILPRKTSYFASMMGLSYSGVKITSAKTRYGSCSSKKSICYSCLLMRCPDELIDYVVVHELAHTVYMDHGRDFYSLVCCFIPDWRDRARRLREFQ